MNLVTPLNADADDFAVYNSDERGEFGTPLVFRGTLDECLAARREQEATNTPWSVVRKRVRRHGHPGRNA